MEKFEKMAEVSDTDARKFKAEEVMTRAVDLVPVKGLLISMNQVLIAHSLLLDNNPPQLEYFREQFTLYWDAVRKQLKELVRNTVDIQIAGEYNQILQDAFNMADADAQKIISGEVQDAEGMRATLVNIQEIFRNEI